MYSDEHRIFQRSVRQFAARQIVPHLNRWEAERNFPNAIFESLGAEGYLGMLLPEEFDGSGGDYLLAGAWCEEFGRVPAVGFTTAINMHALVISPAVNRFGSKESKERWLKPAVAGKAIGAYAFTEPGAGSDLGSIQTKAVPDGDHFVLNGSKTFITNGARAHFVLVLARTGDADASSGYTTFVVDTTTPGFQVTRKLEKLGWHSSDTAELGFQDLRVPKHCVLGQVGQGWKQAMQSLEWERLMLTLSALGGASACLEETVRYVNDRKVFGRSVGQFEATRSTLLSLRSRLETGRALAHRCLHLLNDGKRCRLEVSLAKLYLCELAIEVADRCLQLHGGYGYTTEFPPERWLRDLRLNTIGGGTSQIMSRVAAREIFGDAYSEL